jgi:hypothetical protein
MTLPIIVADLETSLATKIAVGATTGTLISNTDDDGVTLADGTYYFTIDGNNSAKEHIKCTKTGTALSDIYSVSRQGVETSGVVREHRVGAKVIMTDYSTYKNYFVAASGLTGPGSSGDGNLVIWDGTGGDTLKDGGSLYAPRVVSTTDDATSVINTDITDVYVLTAVANDTVFTLTGTPADGQKLIVRFKDAGVAKGLTWTGFTNIGVTAPTTTVAGKQHYVGCMYNGASTRWEVIATGVEA